MTRRHVIASSGQEQKLAAQEWNTQFAGLLKKSEKHWERCLSFQDTEQRLNGAKSKLTFV
jgi:hypothetical protein